MLPRIDYPREIITVERVCGIECRLHRRLRRQPSLYIQQQMCLYIFSVSYIYSAGNNKDALRLCWRVSTRAQPSAPMVACHFFYLLTSIFCFLLFLFFFIFIFFLRDDVAMAAGAARFSSTDVCEP